MWVTAHKILKLYLSIYRDDGWRTTKLKTWDMLKWNAVGDHVYITKRAISEFLSNPVVEKQTKASEYNKAAPKGARCFVAEHMFPTKQLQIFCFDVFKKSDPSFSEFQKVFKALNVICYVWYEEDEILRKSGLNSDITAAKAIDFSDFYYESIDTISLEKNLSRLKRLRYQNATTALDPVKTQFQSGIQLFKKMSYMRNEKYELDDVVKGISYEN